MSDTAGDGITIVPANETSWDDIRAVFGTRGTPARCQCQSFKVRDKDWRSVPVEDRADGLREQTHCGDPGADTTSGLVAYLDGEPAGWCAVEPRTAYIRLLKMRVPWTGRDEDRTDDGVWAVTCFVTRTGFRRRYRGQPPDPPPGGHADRLLGSVCSPAGRAAGRRGVSRAAAPRAGR